ncbi:MAG: peptidylprolyl isomerase [Clostridia bacterium]|nr:peptidylprolyl isomerase [Clostridia bacterium]
MNKKWIYISAAALVVAGLAAAGIFMYNKNNNNDYVAKVGTEKITKTEYTLFWNSTKLYMEKQWGITDLNQNIGTDKAIDVAKNMAFDKAVELEIETAKAKQNNIALEKKDEDEIKTYFDEIVKNYGTKADAEKEITKQLGVNMDQYMEISKQIKLSEKFRQAEQSKIQVTEEEMKKHYEEDKTEHEKVTVRHILVSIKDKDNKDLPADKQKEVEKKANDILAKVKAGEDFAALAKQYSEDPGSKDTGGEYTFAKNGQMVKEFEDWAFSAKAGDVGIVKTQFGYHIMKFEKKSTFEDAKQEIKAEMQSKKYLDTLAQWKKDAQYSVTKNQPIIDSFK